MVRRLFPLCMLAIAFGLTPLAGRLSAQSGDEARWSTPSVGDVVKVLHLRSAIGVDRLLYMAPARARGTIVMLPGGDGKLDLQSDGHILHGDNFVVRTRALWNSHGYGVLIPDTIDHLNLRGERSSPDYAQLISAVVALAKRENPGPVFLLGTSQGSIAAVNGAAHAKQGAIAGVVLTESVSVKGGSGETVFDADPGDVHVPALIVANRDDQCRVAPPGAARRISEALRTSRDVQVLIVSGGLIRSANACGSLSPHGYYGIERSVVSAISHWLDRHS